MKRERSAQIKVVIKDMNEHESYMKDFMTVFATLERWGPGSHKDSLKAISLMSPQTMTDILDMVVALAPQHYWGGGGGLADNSIAHITAVDNEPIAIEQLK